MLSDGMGVKKNPREVLRWLKMDFRGLASALPAGNIAVIYRENGDLRRTVAWFKKCAALGDRGDALQLGIHYYWGKGVRADHVRAVRLFRKAIRSREVSEISEYERDNAFFYLAIAYLEGKGVKKSVAKARKLLERANKDGDHPPAARLLRRLANERAEDTRGSAR